MLVTIQNGCREFIYNQVELEIKSYYDGLTTEIDIQDVDSGVVFKLPIYVIKSFTGEEHEATN